METLLDDVESKPGSLPLLQFALRELWGRQEKRTITRKSYDDIGEFARRPAGPVCSRLSGTAEDAGLVAELITHRQIAVPDVGATGRVLAEDIVMGQCKLKEAESILASRGTKSR